MEKCIMMTMMPDTIIACEVVAYTVDCGFGQTIHCVKVSGKKIKTLT